MKDISQKGASKIRKRLGFIKLNQTNVTEKHIVTDVGTTYPPLKISPVRNANGYYALAELVAAGIVNIINGNTLFTVVNKTVTVE